MNFKDFRNRMKKANTNVKYMDWKKKGKLLFVVHPKSEIGEKTMVRYERIVTNDEGKSDIWGCRRFYQGDNDYSVKFLEWLRSADHIDMDDTVLKLTSDKKSVEYTKGDLLQIDGSSWKKNLLKATTTFEVCAVDIEDPSGGWMVQSFTWGAGNKWWKVVESQIEEFGDEDGDPFVSPYVFKITFDKDAKAPGDMYRVERTVHKIPDEVKTLFEQEPVDIKYLCDPENEDTTQGGTVYELLKAMCVVPCPLFSGKVVEKPSVSKQNDTPETLETPTPAADPGETHDVTDLLVKGGVYDNDGETFIYVGEKKGKYLFKDEEGDQFAFTQADLDNFKPVVVEDDGPQADEASGLRVKDCKKGETYYDLNGEVLEFVRYNNSKNKGVFKDGNGERIQMDGDEFVGYSGVDGDDPLAPIEDSKDAPESDADDMDECGVCGAKLKPGVLVCPDCGTVFEEEEDKPNF